MTTVKRVAPRNLSEIDDAGSYACCTWNRQALRDMAAGKHAVGCECVLTEHPYTRDVHRPNDCSTIRARALAFEDYEILESK
jgi:hypothetical protein